MPVSPQTDLDRIEPGSRGPAPQARHRAPAKVPYTPSPSMQPKEPIERLSVEPEPAVDSDAEVPPPPESSASGSAAAGTTGLAGIGAKAADRLKAGGEGPASVVSAAGASLTGMGARAASRIAPVIAGDPDEKSPEAKDDSATSDAPPAPKETSQDPSPEPLSTSRSRQEGEDESLFAGFGKGAALILLLGLAYLGLTAWQVNNASGEDAAIGAADAIVVLGAAQFDGEPSPVFAGRLQRALDLWDDGLADVIVTTGSNQAGDRFTEGFAGYEWLLERGVPEDKVKIDVSGGSTWEQLSSARTILADREMTTAILVSDPYHRFRLEQIAGEVGLEAVVAGTDRDASLTEFSREVGAVASGRVVGYRRLNNILNPEPDPIEIEDPDASDDSPAEEDSSG